MVHCIIIDIILGYNFSTQTIEIFILFPDTLFSINIFFLFNVVRLR